MYKHIWEDKQNNKTNRTPPSCVFPYLNCARTHPQQTVLLENVNRLKDKSDPIITKAIKNFFKKAPKPKRLSSVMS